MVVTTSRKALKIVAGWGGGESATVGPGGATQIPKSRPARLGLGASSGPAKAEPDAEAFDGARAKLQQSLKKQQRREQREVTDRAADKLEPGGQDDDDDDDDNDDAGRSGAFKPAAKQTLPAHALPAGGKKQKQPTQARKEGGEKRARADPPEPAKGVACEPAQLQAPGAGKQHDKPDSRPPTSRPADGPPVVAAGGAAEAAEGAKKGKRFKTRSKQKNLRRDTRPESLKPTYRTPGAPDYAPPMPPAWQTKKGGEGEAE
ncbi:hypothetical protein T492DRAFT_1107688 [Pavlovales sp. CCMP2436]|nr:hypothetical protein T492DRAFT_1107688 [Pavlovales sp. CCMP2436]|mmetsp:Transcript_33178/g.76522  ORF Transcript_33178/g.76522 Transcript_33178/m.76522 type:complete len:260 (+) Transcript_33178:161-940(+)|eukprot:CAMPEP_0179850458 /NCGR_PEP_ID=MMETSP0982-20121206/7714_1 /TAXON_ID=483367 /ORGANISM="non described non described, Strain CCMP 2436" /LENGTH=259 /DNA_ID=CAMNT_0021735885 /DNA_START=915 /DNA_END=1694 /DNA_ORIENTATION=+